MSSVTYEHLVIHNINITVIYEHTVEFGHSPNGHKWQDKESCNQIDKQSHISFFTCWYMQQWRCYKIYMLLTSLWVWTSPLELESLGWRIDLWWRTPLKVPGPQSRTPLCFSDPWSCWQNLPECTTGTYTCPSCFCHFLKKKINKSWTGNSSLGKSDLIFKCCWTYTQKKSSLFTFNYRYWTK